ncbi:hypothetical protein M407DRAFT_159349 [Tulasnella calospora MUT 4182]|uniref:Uncharacterized protein n=1 Tax=Tulasnella calospora MUT 4182 TaxID=1051891 RepID=A0A0C3PU87_9AGAM|nr:hypothetical protein M407DRAFT_159349 [Tulasnella calospora MUT 4182]
MLAFRLGQPTSVLPPSLYAYDPPTQDWRTESGPRMLSPRGKRNGVGVNTRFTAGPWDSAFVGSVTPLEMETSLAAVRWKRRPT